jgi:hypothetical protein
VKDYGRRPRGRSRTAAPHDLPGCLGLHPPRKRGVIKSRVRTGMIVIPAQAGIHCTRSTAGSGQARSVKPHIGSETCSTVDPGLRRDDAASSVCATHLSEPRNREHQLDYTVEKSGGPGLTAKASEPWSPAFAGLSAKLLISRGSFWVSLLRLDSVRLPSSPPSRQLSRTRVAGVSSGRGQI